MAELEENLDAPTRFGYYCKSQLETCSSISKQQKSENTKKCEIPMSTSEAAAGGNNEILFILPDCPNQFTIEPLILNLQTQLGTLFFYFLNVLVTVPFPNEI